MIYLTWIVFAFVVATLGGHRKIGFWPALALSLILSPIVGLIVTLLSPKIDEHYYPPVTQKPANKEFEPPEIAGEQLDTETSNS